MMNRKLAAALLTGAFMHCSPLFAQGVVGVLDDADAAQADAYALQAEATLFENIRQGIALSIAQCELSPKCSPTVSREELRRIVGKLETRLDSITARHSAAGDSALEPVMLAYVETRDKYSQFLTKLDEILPPESGFEEADVAPVADLPPEFDIFADANATLTDDPDEPPPEAESATPQ